MDLEERDLEEEAAAAEYAAKASLYIGVNVKFYDYKSTMNIGIGPTDTAESLIIDVKGYLVPPEQFQYEEEPFTIRDEDVMLIFQGLDLLSVPKAPLHSFGIQEDDVLVILHRGQFIGYEDSQSCDLQSLVGIANRAVDSSISVEEFVNQSCCDRKNIFVKIPLSEGIHLRISTELKVNDNIRSVKRDIQEALFDQATYNGDGDYLASSFHLVQFDLHFHGNKLSLESTLDGYGIRERDTLELSWIFNGLDVSIATENNERVFFKITGMKYSDTVDQIKARFYHLTGVRPENQLLRYQNKWLKEDSKSLAEYGIIFCPSVIFPWKEHINAVDIFVRVDGSPLPSEMNDLEDMAYEIPPSPITYCWRGKCPLHQSEYFSPEFCQQWDECLAD